MRFLSCLLLLLLCTSVLPAAPLDKYEARAKAAAVAESFTHYGFHCECGCVETGVCKCKNCDEGCKLQLISKSVVQKYTATPCACGCAETGQCVCKNCNIGCKLTPVLPSPMPSYQTGLSMVDKEGWEHVPYRDGWYRHPATGWEWRAGVFRHPTRDAQGYLRGSQPTITIYPPYDPYGDWRITGSGPSFGGGFGGGGCAGGRCR